MRKPFIETEIAEVQKALYQYCIQKVGQAEISGDFILLTKPDWDKICKCLNIKADRYSTSFFVNNNFSIYAVRELPGIVRINVIDGPSLAFGKLARFLRDGYPQVQQIYDSGAEKWTFILPEDLSKYSHEKFGLSAKEGLESNIYLFGYHITLHLGDSNVAIVSV